MARAKADAALIKAESELAVQDLKRRTVSRLLHEEMRNQENIESIVDKALPRLVEGADASKMDDDWIANFFGKCRNFSNEEMQGLWARVLAGEANSPGSFSNRAVNFLAGLNKEDAEAFSILCSFGWNDKHDLPLVFVTHSNIYAENGLTGTKLFHLAHIGLIGASELVGHEEAVEEPVPTEIHYFGRVLRLKPKDGKLVMPYGRVALTRVGKELAPISEAKRIEGFFEMVEELFKRVGIA